VAKLADVKWHRERDSQPRESFAVWERGRLGNSMRGIAISQQSQSVEDDQQGRPFVHRHRWSNAKPEDCRWHEDCDNAQADEDILAYDRPRAAAQTDSERKMP